MDLVRLDVGVGVVLSDGERLPIRHVIGIGRNYAEHATEQGADVPDRPMVFFKSPASTALHGEPIVIPDVARDPEQVDFEAELAVVLGRSIRDASTDDAMDAILGFCCANDVSARWWQKQGSGGQFSRGKSFDTFCPLGPRLTPADAVSDPHALSVRCRVNGEIMQDGTTADMIFPIGTLLADLSRGATLPAGTAILTGTPSGVGMARTPPVYLTHGDRVEVEINGLGVLGNEVRFE